MATDHATVTVVQCGRPCGGAHRRERQYVMPVACTRKLVTSLGLDLSRGPVRLRLQITQMAIPTRKRHSEASHRQHHRKSPAKPHSARPPICLPTKIAQAPVQVVDDVTAPAVLWDAMDVQHTITSYQSQDRPPKVRSPARKDTIRTLLLLDLQGKVTTFKPERALRFRIALTTCIVRLVAGTVLQP